MRVKAHETKVGFGTRSQYWNNVFDEFIKIIRDAGLGFHGTNAECHNMFIAEFLEILNIMGINEQISISNEQSIDARCGGQTIEENMNSH